ncbi:MAG: complex I subunit 5 family protein [Halanaerobiales bacterium]
MGLINNYFYIEKLNILAASMGLFITVLTMFIAYKQINYKLKEYYLVNIIFILSFILMFFTKNWLLFIVSWELITVCTALMLLWKNRGLAGQYLIIQFAGSGFLIFAIVLAVINGYTEISPIKELWLQNFLILGLGLKSAIFGLHFWLPAVHSQAPAPVSAILSGWVVKLGFIMYLRIITDGNLLLLVFGFCMIFYGGIKALTSEDYKVLLAYSSISQLGFIAVGIGSGTIYGFLGSIFHMLAHSLAKSGLFLGSGYLIDRHNSRSIYDFEDSWKRPFIININTLTAFTSLMGFPILAGFNSKYLIKYSFYGEKVFNFNNLLPEVLINFFKINKLAVLNISTGEIITMFLYAGGLLTGLYSLRFLYWGLFRGLGKLKLQKIVNMLGGNEKGNRVFLKKHELGKIDLAVFLLITILLFIFGFYPDLIINRIRQLDISFNIISGIFEFIIITVLALLILKNRNWFKVTELPIPSLDLFFNKINKGVYRCSRSLYNVLYQNFQYQLLWIPLFLVILFTLFYF